MLRNGDEAHRYRMHILVALAVTSTLCSVASAKLVNYVIHISMDALRPDAITNLGPTNLPNFYRFRTEGAFTDNARTDYDYTRTLPNHATQLTGRGVLGTTGHNWTENSDPAEGATLATNKGFYVSGVFDVVHDNGLRTGLYASKSKFSLFEVSWNATSGAQDNISPDNGRDKIDNYLILADTLPLANALVADMEAQAMNYAFIHISDPDIVGSIDGFDPTVGSSYCDTIIDVDARLGAIFNLVDTNPKFTGRTVIILTSDHAGTGTNHNNAALPENYTIPFYVWGPGVTAGASLYSLNPTTRLDPGTGRPTYSASVQPIRNGEVTNVALKVLGLSAIPGSTIGQAQNLALNTTPGPAPSAPTATSATSVTNCGFIAHWNSVSGATGYLIDVATDSAFTHFVSGYQDSVVGNVLSHNVTGLAANTTHYYRVWAYNLNGTSSNSGTINLTTTANNNVPSAPTTTAATSVTSTGFNANWIIACGATGYRLDVSTSNTFSSYVAGYQDLNVGNATRWALSDVSANTTHYYRVRAYNGIGTSENSGNTSVTTLDVNYCIPSVLLGHGNMNEVDSYSVCPEWTGYSAGVGAASWAKEIVIVRSGWSQRVRNINAGAGSLLGIQQTIDANIGDAFTFEGWVYPISNPAYAQVAMAARWDGTTTIPDGGASWKISGGARNTWTHLQSFSGNATATSVTLFLDSRRISGSIDITAYWDDVVSYRAYVPPAPTVTVASSTSLDVNVNAGCNSTNGAAEYAITIGGGAYTLGTHWVQANGSIGVTAIWQTDAAWTIRSVTGLTTGTTYTFKTKARYSSTITQATSLGVGANGTPSNETPTAPTITQHPSSKSVAPGGTAMFTAGATGSGTLSYKWQKNLANLINGGHYSGAMSASLTITGADSNDQAGYRCIVTDNVGSATSNEASLTVTECSPPIFTNGSFEASTSANPPAGWATYVQAATSGNRTIQTISPPQGTQWQQTQIYNANSYGGIRQNVTGLIGGAVYTITGSYKTNSTSATASVRYSLSGNTDRAASIALVSKTDTSWGTFSGSVTASGASLLLFLDHLNGGSTNKASGFDNITVTLTNCSTLVAPTITQQPIAQNICPSTSASFTVAAAGDAPLSYQWQKNNANLANGGHYSGAMTATLTITGSDSNDAANYRCVVSNAGGNTTSNPAALTLKPLVVADLDRDCDVDTFDFDLFAACSSGPAVPVNPGCESSDFDLDNDIDQSDFGIIQRCYGGENMPADPNCGS